MTSVESHLRVALAALGSARDNLPEDIDLPTKLRISYAQKKTRAALHEVVAREGATSDVRTVSTVKVDGGVL